MQLKQWAPALFSLLLGLSTAFPSDFASARSGDLLGARADGDNVRCTPKTCGSLCKIQRRDEFLWDATVPPPVVAVDVPGLSDRGLPLDRRAIDRPQPGKIDKWVSDNWDKAKEFSLGPGYSDREDIDTLQVTSDEYQGAVKKVETSGTRAKVTDFKNEPWMIRIPGLLGCTVVVVANSEHVWMSHHWDTSFMDHKARKGKSDLFDKEVLNAMDDLSCKFDKKKDGRTQAIIYTKTNDPGNFSKQPAYFGDAIKEMQKAISENIPGLNENDVKIVPYVPKPSGASDKSKAVGKLVLSYSPSASAGKRGFELWAGGYKNTKGENLEGESVKEPIMKAEWT
ncbi:helicase associated domain-containing protein [Apiospora arundinis]|uniref:Uncharacterized protein n=1 Tax=Apiospora arundinis TaxID=335852 RepID=A0ABR2JK86_9PEZI